MRILSEKTAIITGGGTGIGAAMAKRFYEEGATVVICGRRIEKITETASLIAPGGNRFSFIQADVTSEKDVENLVRLAIEKTGRIDILVNNAGTNGRKDHRITSVLDLEKAEWDRLVDINLTSVFVCSKMVIPIMVKQKYGNILNISSLAAKTGGRVNGAHYVATKAGVIGLTRALARGYGPDNIRANTFCPGRFETPSNVNVPKDFQQNIIAQIPMGRLGTLREAADVGLFLVSDASSYITGSIIDANGGWFMN